MNTSNEPKPDTKIWRYMSFTKFMSMLTDSALHFSRADIFEDKWEGAVPESIWEEFKKHLKDQDIDTTKKFLKEIRKQTFISCWHINEDESAAMWDLYGSQDGAVAIESKLKDLQNLIQENNKDEDSLLKTISISEVKYINYNCNLKYELNNYPDLFFLKRESFKHEKELRVIMQNTKLIEDIKNWNLFDKFNEDDKIHIEPINLKKLIKCIHISPRSPQWFFTLVKKIVNEDYKLDILVEQSDLYNDPIY